MFVPLYVALNPTVTEPLGATPAFQLSLLNVTAAPDCAHLPPHPWVIFWLPGKLNASVHPGQALVPVFVSVMLPPKPVLQEFAEYATRQTGTGSGIGVLTLGLGRGLVLALGLTLGLGLVLVLALGLMLALGLTLTLWLGLGPGVLPACSAAQAASQATAAFQLIATSLTEYASMWSTKHFSGRHPAN